MKEQGIGATVEFASQAKEKADRWGWRVMKEQGIGATVEFASQAKEKADRWQGVGAGGTRPH